MTVARHVKTTACIVVCALAAVGPGCTTGGTYDTADVGDRPRPVTPPAAPAGETQAKDIFYSPPQPTPQPTQMALSYKIMLTRGGVEQQVTEATPFHAGDQLRLVFLSSLDGHLYIFNKGTTGAGRMLFPDPRINGGSNWVTRHAEYAVPAAGSFTFDAVPGIEEVIVFLAPKRLDAINFAPGAVIPAPAWQQVVAPFFLKHQKAVASQATKDIVYVDEGQEVAGPPAPQVYVATEIVPAADYDSLLIHTIRLIHQ